MGDTAIEEIKSSVIIIGAGASGLIAARELAEAGMKVTVLEAQAVPGGRMQTLKTDGFSVPVESGAEFVHGPMALTLGLLQEAGIEFTPVSGDMRTVRGGQWLDDDPMSEHWESLMNHMHELQDDITVDQFLDRFFAEDKYADLRKSVRNFAQGFDLADPALASVKALKDEWAHEEQEQYRVHGGYLNLVNYLVDCCREKKVDFYFSQQVMGVHWKEGAVEVITAKQSFTASRVLVTVSAGVMQEGKIQFTPEISDHTNAFQRIGFGSVIKFLFEFDTNFWINKLPDGGFVLSDEQVPTWWMQSAESKLFTGWVGGRAAAAFDSDDEVLLLEKGLQSLSNIFGRSSPQLRSLLVHSRVISWKKNAHVLGGYSYSFPDSLEARKLLLQSVANTIYFAGEALYSGDNPATVEAALQTGVEAATRILGDLPIK